MRHLRKGSNMRTIDKDATIEALQQAANANIAEHVGGNVYRYTDDYKGLVHAVSIVEDMPEVLSVVLCKDCHWWTKQEDSLQGRCALSGKYPTGGWYCANGRRRGEQDDQQRSD